MLEDDGRGDEVSKSHGCGLLERKYLIQLQRWYSRPSDSCLLTSLPGLMVLKAELKSMNNILM